VPPDPNPNPNRYHFVTVVYVAKRHPSAVLLPDTYAALLGMLQPAGAGVRRNPQLACLAAVVLGHGLTQVDNWPIELALVRTQLPHQLTPNHSAAEPTAVARGSPASPVLVRTVRRFPSLVCRPVK